jgi:rhomboid protease GluP
VEAFYGTLRALTPRVFITLSIVVLNLTVFAAMVACGVHVLTPDGFSLIQGGANFGPMTIGGEWWRLITCTFVHIGILHLYFNMWVLWHIGRLVERLLGNSGLFVVYVLSGFVGSLASIYWHPIVISAGASGAIFGLFGGLLGFLFLRRGSIPPEALSDLRSSGWAFVIFNLIFGLTVPGIDIAGHLGGFATGFLCGMALALPLTREAATRRNARALAIAVVGGIAVALAARAMPEGPVAHITAMEHAGHVEKKAIDAHNSWINKLKSGAASEEDTANGIARDVLPQWRTARERLAALKDVPPEFEKQVAHLLKYMKLRQEAWELLVEALREQDLSKAQESRKKAEAAEAMAQ